MFFSKILYSQKIYFECEIPNGKLIEEVLCPSTQGGCITTIKLLYKDSIVVLHRTNPNDDNVIVNRGIMANALFANPDNPIYQGVSSRGFVLTDTSFVCIWTLLEPAAIRSYWLVKFSIRNNKWQPTIFKRILDYMEGATSTGYYVYFLNDHVVYLTPGRYHRHNNHNEFNGIFIILNNDGSITKFAKDD